MLSLCGHTSRTLSSFTFHDRNDLIDGQDLHFFSDPIRPEDFDFVYFRRRTQTEVQALIRTGGVAAAAEHIPTLTNPPGSDKHSRPNRITRALRSADQFQRQPMI